LLLEVRRLALEDRFDYLLIESTGISEPLPVAETFTFEDEEGVSLSQVARLDTLVTVVDAVNFRRDYESAESLPERGLAAHADDTRSLVQLLIDQIEFANVLVISKCDLVPSSQLGELEELLRLLNPTARIERATAGAVALDAVLHTQRFSPDWAALNQQWLAVARGQETSETEEYGFSSFVFEARRPFHPERWLALVESTDFADVVRSKGVIWLATRHDDAVEWSQAGLLYQIQRAGRWAASTGREEWPEDEQFLAEIADVWEEPWGDRRTELVIIGQDLEVNLLRQCFEACLLSDAEMQTGPTCWATWTDPMEAWSDELPSEETASLDR
jgi:G3E family GTPase